ncbi:hypothetical protein ACFC1T_09280 [Kitasatospora sp. NPDC056076]|uniref:hypothetical protein n=1 Tax=Kitasatospora sp. NPDC056076 TaxID=3345703 RepID=UPI0035DE8F88
MDTTPTVADLLDLLGMPAEADQARTDAPYDQAADEIANRLQTTMRQLAREIAHHSVSPEIVTDHHRARHIADRAIKTLTAVLTDHTAEMIARYTGAPTITVAPATVSLTKPTTPRVSLRKRTH